MTPRLTPRGYDQTKTKLENLDAAWPSLIRVLT